MESCINRIVQNGDHRPVPNRTVSDQCAVSRDQYFSDVFSYKDGHLYCEEKSVKAIKQWLQECSDRPSTPFFVYSRTKLVSNVRAYLQSFETISRKCFLNYAVKANMNPNLALLMKTLGCSATLVSGLELRMVLDLGFEPQTLVLNGNGKQNWEVELAIRNGCLLNIDSDFNMRQTATASRRLNKKARVLIRVNPNIDPEVHSYNTTGTLDSKFGIGGEDLLKVLDEIRQENWIDLVGLHCHLGSTITSLTVFRRAATVMTELFHRIKNDGFPNMEFINLGGGLGIPYTRHSMRTQPNGDDAVVDEPVKIPSPADVVKAIDEVISDPAITLILEPGRSLIGDTAILVCSVLGVKHCQNKSYIVVDGSMTEVLRPALYGAYHHIDMAQLPVYSQCEKRLYDIVGPVCESGDFLGKGRYLATPDEGCCLAVFDVGAYCSSMSSNYNFRPRCAEVLVDKDHCTMIRQPDTYDSIMAPFLPVQEQKQDSEHLQ